MKESHLQQIREFELEKVLQFLPSDAKILEIGAGNGWQARKLASKGYNVQAIELEGSERFKKRYWPLVDYDGKHIPFPNQTFDIVFSSNVLEHIPHINAFQEEIKRVLTPNGKAIHILPSAHWRAWTNITYYFYMVRKVTAKLLNSNRSKSSGLIQTPQLPCKNSIFAKILPNRHGEKGNFVTEIYYFSRYRWRKFFKTTGWQVDSILPNDLIYTGHSIFSHYLTIKHRNCLSKALGSSCLIYVLKKHA